MTSQDFYEAIAKLAGLSEAKATVIAQAVGDSIGQALKEGDPVRVEGWGYFYTEKSEPVEVEDPPGSGRKVITLPEIEPVFDPDKEMVHKVMEGMKKHPELFSNDREKEVEEEITHLLNPIASKKEDGNAAVPKEKEQKVPEKPEPEKSEKKERPLSRASFIEYRDLTGLKIDPEVLKLIPEHMARQYGSAPIDLSEGVLTVAMIDPEDFDALQVIRKESGLRVKQVLVTRDDLNTVLDQYTGLQAEVQEAVAAGDFGISEEELVEASQENLLQDDENAPTVKIVNSLLKRAVKGKASDVHIEPYERKVVVRYRVDGVLQKQVELPKEVLPAVVARLKILASLKIDEQRLPQDGRFNLMIDKRQVDFRLSTIPCVYGEKVVLRILDKAVGIISLEDVGLTGHGFDVLTKNMERSHGMILVTGPTGSGKTTTLYAVLGKMMGEGVNILTLEDPVEYRIESINQSQVHSDIGYTFASGLRAAVRQDPDIVMLGEIRDQETADMAVHAALTGHIVLSTLHTNDAAGAFPRLIDMGVEPFLITSSVHTVIAQRLARLICPECKEKVEIPKEELAEVMEQVKAMPEAVREGINQKELAFYHGKGCEKCGGKGYKGRAGIFEVLDVTEPVRDLILKRSSNTDITRQAVEEGMVTMVQDGILKALMGKTTLQEVWRVTKE